MSGELAAYAGYDDPLEALTEVANWASRQPLVQGLMEEHRTFEFMKTNLQIRVFLSHFVAFCADRIQHPEFFCWPGIWKTSGVAKNDMTELWLRHLSLFSDRGEKSGVYPRRWPNRNDEAVKGMFDSFYGSMAVYDLTRQWILQDGSFVCDYRWLFENYSQAKADEWANDSFKQVYGVGLEDFSILTANA